MKNLNEALKLCLVTNIGNRRLAEYGDFLRSSIKGGVTMIQLREKSQNIDEIHARAIYIKSITDLYNIPLIINDHVRIAHDVNADGIHIGQTDMNPSDARKILGNRKIIGLSIETADQLEKANKSEAINYVTVGAIFQTSTKTDCKRIWGTKYLADLVKFSHHPITAIGGINHRNISEIMDKGVHGVAVIGAIHDAPDPYIAVKNLMKLIE